MKRRTLKENPFRETSLRSTTGAEKRYFVPEDDAYKLLDVADPTWQSIIALARFGGLRCPSEVCSLKWQDVDLPSGRMVITSPKTEHHAGGESRVCPIFPRLRPYLEAAWEAAPEGAEYVVDERYRKAALGPKGWVNCNLRQQFGRIIRRAGLKPWARLFHAMRGSLETELMERHPIHAVTAWLGHDSRVAMKHYLMVRNADFEAALQGGTESGTLMAQNAAQQPAALSRMEKQNASQPFTGEHLTQPRTSGCDSVLMFRLAGAGLEPAQE